MRGLRRNASVPRMIAPKNIPAKPLEITSALPPWDFTLKFSTALCTVTFVAAVDAGDRMSPYTGFSVGISTFEICPVDTS